MIEKHNLKPARGSRTTVKRVGRGNASGLGKTAGRGHKGQRARSGGRNKLKLKGLRAMVLAFPKKRGFKSTYPNVETLTLGKVAANFKPTEVVTLEELKKKQLVPKSAKVAKVVLGGEAKSAVNLKGIKTSVTAKEAIEKAGGTVK
ncbi:MAG: 50S ribosomal protein L15 [Patescibacteria group bacterium]|nr:50S ribosomal protein L15 [Patescibacteria group bacterium]